MYISCMLLLLFLGGCIKGETPGQVIRFKERGLKWLRANREQGGFRTDVSDSTKRSWRGAQGGALLTIHITSGDWYRVGFVWECP